MAGVLLHTRTLRYNGSANSGSADSAICHNPGKFSTRYNSAALSGGQSGGLALTKRHIKDTAYGGMYAISGVVKEDGVLSINRVVLLDRRSWWPIRSTVSNAAGQYSFQNLRNDVDFLLVAVDDEGSWQARAFDFVRAA